MGLQEIKMTEINDRILSNLSTRIDKWFVKPAVGVVGNSGGILVGVNTSMFTVIDTWVMDFSISILIENKNDNFHWLFTVVYGPVLAHQRSNFLLELDKIYNLKHTAWLICGERL